MAEVKRSIGKSEVSLIICAILIAVFATSTVLLYMRVDNLQNQIINVQSDKYSLQTQVNRLTNDKNNLQNEVESLTTEVDDLQSEVDSLQIEKSQLESEIDWLNNKYDNYVATHEYSDWEYEDAQFYFYYVPPDEQKFGVYDLEDELYGLEWTHPYEEGVFDCSEMSASMERYLENEGWNTLIIVGDSPFGSGRHAWLLVETSDGKYMPVESTTIEIVWWPNPNFDNYFEYDHSFETIQDALVYSETEFDWWM